MKALFKRWQRTIAGWFPEVDFLRRQLAELQDRDNRLEKENRRLSDTNLLLTGGNANLRRRNEELVLSGQGLRDEIAGLKQDKALLVERLEVSQMLAQSLQSEIDRLTQETKRLEAVCISRFGHQTGYLVSTGAALARQVCHFLNQNGSSILPQRILDEFSRFREAVEVHATKRGRNHWKPRHRNADQQRVQIQ